MRATRRGGSPMDDNWGDDAIFKDVPDMLLDEIFTGDMSIDVMPLETFQPLQLPPQDGERPAPDNAPQRKRRAPDAVQLDVPVVGKLDVPTPEMEKLLTFRVDRPTGDGTTTPAAVTARDELVKLTQLCKMQTQQVERLRQMQFTALKSASRDMQATVQQQLIGMLQTVSTELAALDMLTTLVLLDALEMYQIRFLDSHFRLLLAHVTALRSELEWHLGGGREGVDGSLPFFGSVVVRDQPETSVVFKGKSLDDHYTVDLVCGVADEVHCAATARADIVSDDVDIGKAGATLLENGEATLDAFRKQATFHHVRPMVSSRMLLAALRFHVLVLPTANRAQLQVTSAPCDPVIIITHESQWTEAACKLVMHDVFRKDTALAVTWAKFANVVHAHYLRSSRQDYRNAQRKLTMPDLHYFFNRFIASPRVSHTQATRFLQWFGPVLQALRFKRHVRPMWFAGIIFGFIDKERCNHTLSAFEEGTFLIRFSESSPGQFAIAYVSDDVHERVKHYLVKPEDLAPNKTLADVIQIKPQWQQLLLLDYNSMSLTRRPKDKVLANYYSAESSQGLQKKNGYVML